VADVAIIGMACLFPGAPDLETFWANVVEGVDAIRDVPPGRWDPIFYDPATAKPDRFYARRGGFIDELARFEPSRYGIMPVAAKGAEPDQLLALEVASRALADAGYETRGIPRSSTGVLIGRGNYAGVGRTRLTEHVRGAEQVVRALRAVVPGIGEAELAAVKAELQAAAGPVGADSAIGLVPNLTASRIANRLDLQGPAYTIDAACASALVAVDQACAELGARRCDLVLAGGVHLCQDEAFWSVFCQLGALSRGGRIRPFDKSADGILIGEGIGLVVLKRRADAERDGDRIYAVLRGTGVASDGRDASLMSPRVEGQLLALERAWRDAGCDPASVGLVEAHGTGTPAGDAAELETLARFFGPAGDEPRAGLGSVKSMIGHAMPAAGAAGLIKAALAVYHGVLPPTLHVDEPHAALEKTRFRLVGKSEPWNAAARRAGVNAFGFGGINAHVVLENRAPARRWAAARPPVLHAEVRGAARLLVFDPTPERRARAEEVAAKGKPWRGKEGIWFSPSPLLLEGAPAESASAPRGAKPHEPPRGPIAFAFPGLDAAFAPRVDDLAARFGFPVPDGVDAASIEETGVGIIGTNRLVDRALRACGVEPDLLLGHSIGEWSGMIAAGMVPDDVVEGFIAGARGAALARPGVFFAACGCGREQAEAAFAGLADIALSHDNCPHQVILCGVEESIDAAVARLRKDGVLCQKLPFQSGFHTPLFAGHVALHRENFARLALAPATRPLWSSTTCAPYPADLDAVRALAAEHLLAPVRFRELVETLYAGGVRVFVQAGTGSLVQFIEDTLRGRPHLAVAANVRERSGVDQLRRTLAALWVEGADVDLERLWPKARGEMLLPLGVPLATPTTVVRPAAPKPQGRLASAFADTLDAIARANAEVLAKIEEPQRERHSVRRLSLATLPELIDHTFFRQPQDWPVLSDRHPVVPMTALIALMIDEAAALRPGRVAVAVEDVRAFRWLVVSTPVDAVFQARAEGDRVSVSIDGYAEATVVLAAAYPPPPLVDGASLANARPAPCTAETLYTDRWMFHGPAYRGVVALGPVGDDAIRGTLETGAALGALLDNAGQLFGYWVMIHNDHDRMAMPVAIRRLAFFGPHPTPGERLDCTVRIRRHEARAVVADLSLARDGKTWCAIDGWEDRRFDTDDRLWPVMRYPEENLLGEPRPGGWIWFADAYRSAPTRDQLARRFLGEKERAVYDAQPPKTQRAWLSGRIAAKDAVRRLLAKKMFPVEVALDSDADGRPRVTAPPQDLRVSIAHKGDAAVALAAAGRDVGIDVELVEPRDQAFAETAFSEDELRLIATSDDRDEWLTRLWAAKEAAGKARGTGLAGNPRRLRVTDRTGERVLVDGLPVETRREGAHVVAWTIIT
jgi:acyl transferase domain-containing protein